MIAQFFAAMALACVGRVVAPPENYAKELCTAEKSKKSKSFEAYGQFSVAGRKPPHDSIWVTFSVDCVASEISSCKIHFGEAKPVLMDLNTPALKRPSLTSLPFELSGELIEPYERKCELTCNRNRQPSINCKNAGSTMNFAKELCGDSKSASLETFAEQPVAGKKPPFDIRSVAFSVNCVAMEIATCKLRVGNLDPIIVDLNTPSKRKSGTSTSLN